ncbi:agmatinase 1 [Purpureocillium lilacinum]|uniref:Agmatinase 1 n=1 Tax=Purpureocillium lilacinum TaxID=33203 RepID=A0A179HAI5_PURLI|nr:agmatinase 1 [Purpureocillium lilacinum]OAQ87295.1 agmatinase 1 [Purpureocillium lilacinum]OAQ95245.1 agmatinase 1 [Purpureocillium lilacinum]
MIPEVLFALAWAGTAAAHAGHEQKSLSGPHQSLWYNTLPGDGGTQVSFAAADSVFSGISTFGRLPYQPCLRSQDVKYDIVLRLTRALLTALALGSDLLASAKDPRRIQRAPEDQPVQQYDNTFALRQIEEGHFNILTRSPVTDADKRGPAIKGKTLPRVITLGGDHTITLPLLRSINRAYGPVSVIHFDRRPKVFGGSPSEVASINHGTYFYHAAMEGLLANDTNIHAGIRTTLSGPSDYDNDGYCGFEIVEAREIDKIGTDGIIKRIVERVGTTRPVYLSIDIDTLDPAFAPATGTPETGGWSTRELRTILRGLEELNLIAADIVEVPAYDTNAEHTTMAAADVLYEVMSIMVKKGPLSKMITDQESSEL